MTAKTPLFPRFEFEAFGAAVGSALVCGSLSVLSPVLVAPTATLAALALAGWVSLGRRQGLPIRGRFRGPSTFAFVILGATTLGFLIPPPPLAPFRALLLAGGLVPLLMAERTRSARPPPVFSGP